jgi:hypothetical protein
MGIAVNEVVSWLEGVEVWLNSISFAKGVEILCRGTPSEKTTQGDKVWTSAFEAWSEQAGDPTRGDPPEMPGNLLRRLRPLLFDDQGTLYELTLVAVAVAGTDTPWDAEWRFRPAPPRTAQQLSVSFVLDNKDLDRPPIVVSLPTRPATSVR